MASSAHDHALPAGESAGTATPDRTATVLVYSSHAATRARVMTALGVSPTPGLALSYVEASRGDEVVAQLDSGTIDLAILDGESAPTGGMGLARQLKDEVDSPPPVLLLVGRRDDAWLATWSRAEGVLSHPIDAVAIAKSVSRCLPAMPARSQRCTERPVTAVTEAAITWPSLLSALLAGTSLSAAQTGWAMGEIMAGEATPAQIAGFAIALRSKGETSEEVLGLARVMIDHAVPLKLSGPMVDTCGTGGDRAATVNISTLAALVVCGAGATVVKHGNRAASSACGSADLLEELGVAVDLPSDGVRSCVETAGIGFCFAPVFHASFRHTGPPRRELGVPTVFNFLGPLTNPAQPPAQAVGVSDERMAGVMAGVLAARGASALVFRGTDGLDELSVCAPSRVWVVSGGEVREDSVDPADLGIPLATAEALRGADAPHNAAISRRLLAGETGAVRDAVLLNAAAALVAVEGTTAAPVTEQLSAALPRAAESLDSGAAAAALARWVEVSQAARA